MKQQKLDFKDKHPLSYFKFREKVGKIQKEIERRDNRRQVSNFKHANLI